MAPAPVNNPVTGIAPITLKLCYICERWTWQSKCEHLPSIGSAFLPGYNTRCVSSPPPTGASPPASPPGPAHPKASSSLHNPRTEPTTLEDLDFTSRLSEGPAERRNFLENKNCLFPICSQPWLVFTILRLFNVTWTANIASIMIILTSKNF